MGHDVVESEYKRFQTLATKSSRRLRSLAPILSSESRGGPIVLGPAGIACGIVNLAKGNVGHGNLQIVISFFCSALGTYCFGIGGILGWILMHADDKITHVR